MNLPKVYEPSAYESDIYALWEKTEAFRPRGEGDGYSIVVPPPNANGNLHIGHALTLAVEDVAVRYHRLKGQPTLFVPGADHAGFETQVVYERQLAKEGKSRFDYSREELYAQIWEFVAQNRDNYEDQFRRLGASVDWTHYTFTLDDKIVTRAYQTFKKLWDDSLVYRGERLVNYCTFHGTAFADIEVEYAEEQGTLWYLKYPLTDGSGHITVATTRPETMLGDTAVAVHPDDEQLKDLIGKTVKLPITGREIPIVADSFVEIGFGTGAVKITPAHDPNDFEVAERHALPKISVIDHEGKITADMPAAFRGLPSLEARQKIVATLESEGIVEKAEEHMHNVGHCYKCGTVIQPLLREQWFINMQPLAKEAIASLERDEITFYPESKKTQLIQYLHNLRDWNISRQIAWGIPIPAFQNIDEPDDWIYDERAKEEFITVNGKTYHRDPDVFDTWFSSSSWPYATLNYPDGDSFKQFYPLGVMETGFDILYPWVSRMIMLGLYITGEVPFKNVYLHGLVLDEHGQKMSKSKGNVINPMDAVNEYGSDALRMGILSGQTPGSNQPYSSAKVIGARNFCNKLWNIARYVEGVVDGNDFNVMQPEPQSPADHWMLSKLQHTINLVSLHLDNYRFSEAYETMYHFVWDDFADWYLEASKTEQHKPLIAWALKSILQLTHPFAPFVTETIWQTLNWQQDDILATSSWPQVMSFDPETSARFESLKTIISEARDIQRALKLTKATLLYQDSALIADNQALIKRIAKLGDVRQGAGNAASLALTETSESCWLDVSSEQIQAYKDDLLSKATEHQNLITQLESRLNNTGYVERAPAKLVTETKQQLVDTQKLLENVRESLKRFV